MPEPSGSHAAVRSSPSLKVNRLGDPLAKGWSTDWSSGVNGSPWLHPMTADERASANVRRFMESVCAEADYVAGRENIDADQHAGQRVEVHRDIESNGGERLARG